MDFPTFKQEFHIKGIDLLPHRDPFLFVDELVAADETGCIGHYTFTDANTAIPGKTVNRFFEQAAPSSRASCCRKGRLRFCWPPSTRSASVVRSVPGKSSSR